MQTYTYFIIILLSWGIWGFIGKYALKYMTPMSLLFYETIFIIAIQALVLVFLLLSKNKFQTNMSGFTFALIAAIFGSIGAILFYFALSRAEASVAVPLTALYPAVTIILSLIFLKEKLTLMQGIGVVLAIAAGGLLSI